MERLPHLSSLVNKLLIVFFLLGSPLAFSATTGLEDVLDDAKEFLRSNNPQAAYELLASREADFTGSDSYDYLLGVAALDSSHPGEAIFSLQRLVVRKPDFAGARLELARAYFEVGDNELARTEFNRIMQEDPPEKVRTAVDRYMTAIDVRARAYQKTLQYYVELGAGYDDNPAAATADDQFLSFILDDNNVEQSSSFAQVTAGVMYSSPLSPYSQLLLGGNFSHRSNPSAHFVDPTTLDISAVYAWENGANAASVGATAMKFNLDGSSNKSDVGIIASYRRTLSDTWSLDVFGRAGQARYDDELDVQDVDQWMLGLGATYTNDTSRISFGVLGQEDDAQESGSPFSNDAYGVQASGIWILRGGRSLNVTAVALSTDYDDPFFGFDREDDLYSLSIGHTWNRFPTKDWALTMHLTYSEKDSDISLYEFDRFEFGFTVRRVFD